MALAYPERGVSSTSAYFLECRLRRAVPWTRCKIAHPRLRWKFFPPQANIVDISSAERQGGVAPLPPPAYDPAPQND